jgi:hypothetical protein
VDAERLRHMVIVAANSDDAHEQEVQLIAEMDKDESILFCITTRYGMFRHLSIGFMAITGWQRYDTGHVTWHSLIHPDDVADVSAFLGQMEYLSIAKEVPLKITTRLQHKSGIYIRVNLWVVGWTKTGLAYTCGEMARE